MHIEKPSKVIDKASNADSATRSNKVAPQYLEPNSCIVQRDGNYKHIDLSDSFHALRSTTINKKFKKNKRTCN